MQTDRIYNTYPTSEITKAYNKRTDTTNFTGQESSGINMSNFVVLLAVEDIPQGSIVKIVPYEIADIDIQGEDGFKAVFFSANTEVGACGVSMAELKAGQFGFFQTKGFFTSVLFSESTTDGKQVYVKADGSACVTQASGLMPVFGMFTIGAFTIASPATTTLATCVGALPLSVGEVTSGGGGGGDITSSQITDATNIGKSILTSTDATAVWGEISSAAIGTTATTAMAGNAKPATAVLADEAIKLQIARTFTFTGGATGSTATAFDGSAPATVALTLATPTGSIRGGVLQQAAPTADAAAIISALQTAGVFAS